MNCQICKTIYDSTHLTHMETFIDYAPNTVVVDMLNQTPEVFVLLLEIARSQVKYPSRFLPMPSWFATASAVNATTTKLSDIDPTRVLNMKKIGAAIDRVKTDQLREMKFPDDASLSHHIGEDAYMLLRFTILSNPIQLDHVNKSLEGCKLQWQQYRVVHPSSVEQAWEQRRPSAETPIDYLYHGSPVSNWHSIMRNGLKVVSGSKWMTTGAAYGVGIYLSNTLSVSYSYSVGTLAARHDADLILGVYEVYDASRYKKAEGYYVVAHEPDLLLRYLIYLPKVNYNIMQSLDENLRAEWVKKSQGRSSQIASKLKRTGTRVAKEVQMLEDAGAQVRQVGDTMTVQMGTGEKITIKLPYKFPFDAPEILGMPNIHEIWTIKSSIAAILGLL